MPAFLSGLIGGFSDTARRGREESARAAELQYARESKVLEYLAGADDPEISNAAITSMLDLAAGTKRPKGGFLSRLMGDPEATTHPAVANLMKLVRTPVSGGPGLKVTTGASVSPANDGAAGALPPGASAAMPAQSLAEGPPGRAPAAPVPVLPNVSRGPVTVSGGTTTETAGPPDRPRQIFHTPAQKMRETTIARGTAEVEGEYAGLIAAGFAPEDAREQLKTNRRAGSATPFQSVMLEVPDGKGGFMQVAGFANRALGQYTDAQGVVIPNARPRQTTGSTSLGSMRESLARAEYGGRAFGQLQPHEQQAVIAAETRLLTGRAGGITEARNQADATKPLTPQEKLSGEMQMRNNFQRFVELDRRSVQQGTVIAKAKEQFDQNLIDGAPLGAQSQAIVQAFNRMIDDLSAVRNEEYDRTGAGQPIQSRIEGWWQKITQGGAGIAKSEVDNIVGLALALVDGRRANIRREAEITKRSAETSQLDPANILPGDMLAALGPSTAAATGARVATPPPVLGAGGTGAGNTTLNLPAAPPSAPLVSGRPFVGGLVDGLKHPWYTKDIDSAVHAAQPAEGQEAARVQYTEPNGTVHIIVKFRDGRVVVLQ